MVKKIRTSSGVGHRTQHVLVGSLLLFLPACSLVGGKTTTLSLQTTPPSIASGSQMVFTATISHNNGQFLGANWTLANNGVACPSACGTLSNPTNSGSQGNGGTATITYTAPATAPKPNSVTITATSVENPNSSGSDTFIISGAVLAVQTTSVPQGTVGVGYSSALQAVGGTPPYSWSYSPGASGYPPGLNFDATGNLTGTPTASGSFNFTVQVSDSSNATATANLAIVVNTAPAGIALSSMSGAPGSPLTIQGSFNTGASTNVMFSDGASYTISVPIAPSSANTLSLPVPIYLTSASTSAGTVTVSVVQTLKGNSTTLGSVSGFQISDLPSAPGALGDVTIAVLSSISSFAEDAKYNWYLVATASQGQLDASKLDTHLQSTLSDLSSLSASVHSIATGGPALTIATGKTSAQLDASALAMLDRILWSFLAQNIPSQQITTLRSARRTATSNLVSQPYASIQVPTWATTLLPDLVAYLATAAAVGVVAVEVGAAAVPAAIIGATAATVWFAAALIVDVDLLALEANATTIVVSDYQIGQTVSSTLDNLMTSISETFSGIASSLLNDSTAQNNDMNPTDTTSALSSAEQDETTISSNLPAPPTSAPAPQIQLSSLWTSTDGSANVGVSVVNGLPNTTYQVQSSFGGPTTVTTDQWGYGWSSFGTPPLQGSCMNTNASLVNGGATVAYGSGCFGGTVPQPCSASNIWVGYFSTSTGGSGTIWADLTGNGTAVTGLVTVVDNKGNHASNVTGTNNNGTVSLGPVTVDGATVSTTGTFSPDCQILSGDFLDVSTKTKVGSYSVTGQ